MATWVRTVLVLALAVLAPLARARAEEPAALADDVQATAAYRAGDLATAREKWLATLELPVAGGPDRARVLYNLGNVAFREGKKLEAVGWYTAALRMRPRDADTWANLEHARREAKLEPADRGDLGATLRLGLSAFEPGEARLLALFGLLLWGATLGYEALRGGRVARWVAVGGFAVAAALSVPWLHGALTAGKDPVLLIEENKTLVRSEPRADAAVIAELVAGTETERTDALPGWTEVKLDDGSEGWVPAGSVFTLRR